MTQSVQSIIELGSRMGLQGFATTEKRSVEAGGDQKPGAGAAALATAKQTGLKGFTMSTPVRSQPPRSEGTMALAVRLGLPGFVRKEVAAAEGSPAPKAATLSPTILASQTPAPVTSQLPVAPAPQLSKQQFVCIDIAAGGMAAFTALEVAMGQPFAPKTGGNSAWLQRDKPDGSQTRGYPAMPRELGKLATMSGNLGSSSLRLTISSLLMSEFTPHTAAGRVPKNTRASAAFVDPDLPVALQRALAQ
jgi:hypothetical protein